MRRNRVSTLRVDRTGNGEDPIEMLSSSGLSVMVEVVDLDAQNVAFVDVWNS